MSTNGKHNGTPARDKRKLASIHFDGVIIDAQGKERRELYEDEAVWREAAIPLRLRDRPADQPDRARRVLRAGGERAVCAHAARDDRSARRTRRRREHRACVVLARRGDPCGAGEAHGRGSRRRGGALTMTIEKLEMLNEREPLSDPTDFVGVEVEDEGDRVRFWVFEPHGAQAKSETISLADAERLHTWLGRWIESRKVR